MDYFNRIFVFDKTYFISKHSIDIFLMSVCQVFAEFQFILLTLFRMIFAETEMAESTPCIQPFTDTLAIESPLASKFFSHFN